MVHASRFSTVMNKVNLCFHICLFSEHVYVTLWRNSYVTVTLLSLILYYRSSLVNYHLTFTLHLLVLSVISEHAHVPSWNHHPISILH